LLRRANLSPENDFHLHFAFTGPGVEHSVLWISALRELDGGNDQSHFKYGHFYATLNRANAYRYAIGNPYRSEFILALAKSLEVLRSTGDPLPDKVASDYPAVARAIENPSPPIVIELQGISPDRLMTAKGNSDIKFELESFRRMQLHNGLNAPADFRVEHVTPADIVAVHDLCDWPVDELDDDTWRPNESKVGEVRISVQNWLMKQNAG